MVFKLYRRWTSSCQRESVFGKRTAVADQRHIDWPKQGIAAINQAADQARNRWVFVEVEMQIDVGNFVFSLVWIVPCNYGGNLSDAFARLSQFLQQWQTHHASPIRLVAVMGRKGAWGLCGGPCLF